MKALKLFIIVMVTGIAVFWWLTRPLPVTLSVQEGFSADSGRGEQVFHAGGCASCHGSLLEGKPSRESLGGGLEMHTGVGVFRVPNISPHADDGIGRWTDEEFLGAVKYGISPGGAHYYPAFPYTSYVRMTDEDILDLRSYIDTTPAVAGGPESHDLSFPFNIQRGVGLWKLMFLDASPIVELSGDDELLERGRYLVEGPGHCGECHTPRGLFQQLDFARWLEGAPAAEGEGKVPGIHADRLTDWTEDDLAYYLESGIDPEFDVVGGAMVSVQENMSKLTATDREAIAAYLKHRGD